MTLRELRRELADVEVELRGLLELWGSWEDVCSQQEALAHRASLTERQTGLRRQIAKLEHARALAASDLPEPRACGR